MAELISERELAALSLEDRMRLLELVWSSVSSDAPPPGWHDQLLEQRLERMKSDPQPGVTWPEVRESLRRKRDSDAAGT